MSKKILETGLIQGEIPRQLVDLFDSIHNRLMVPKKVMLAAAILDFLREDTAVQHKKCFAVKTKYFDLSEPDDTESDDSPPTSRKPLTTRQRGLLSQVVAATKARKDREAGPAAKQSRKGGKAG